jgi:hypothetical protein
VDLKLWKVQVVKDQVKADGSVDRDVRPVLVGAANREAADDILAWSLPDYLVTLAPEQMRMLVPTPVHLALGVKVARAARCALAAQESLNKLQTSTIVINT